MINFVNILEVSLMTFLGCIVVVVLGGTFLSAVFFIYDGIISFFDKVSEIIYEIKR